MNSLYQARMWLFLFAASCGGGSEQSATFIDASGGMADSGGMTVDAAIEPDASGGAEDAGPVIDADMPAASDAAPAGMMVTSVQTVDGFTQVRQGSTLTDSKFLEFVVVGLGLGGVTSVTVGEMNGFYVDATDDRVTFELWVPHAQALGPRTVTVSGADGSVAVPDAIEVTPYVVGPLGSGAGNGTYQSPMYLCDERVQHTRAGDTILLLAGLHTCRRQINLGQGGQIVRGQGTMTTLLGEIGYQFGGFRLAPQGTTLTTFRDFAMFTTVGSGGSLLMYWGGEVVLERVSVRGGSIRVGVCDDCTTRITVNASVITEAHLEASGRAAVNVSTSSFSFGGIETSGGQLAITNSLFEGSSVLLNAPAPGTDAGVAEIRDSEFKNNQRSAIVRAGRLSLFDSIFTVEPESSSVFDRGISIDAGELEATRVQFRGHARSAIHSFVSASQVNSVRVTLDDVLIEGGEFGVLLEGSSEGGGLVMSSTTIRDQTVAAVRLGWARAVVNNLNGDNQLSVLSGVALDDVRVNPVFGTILAAGITLNGNSYSGRVEGPVDESPDYRIADERGAIRF